MLASAELRWKLLEVHTAALQFEKLPYHLKLLKPDFCIDVGFSRYSEYIILIHVTRGVVFLQKLSEPDRWTAEFFVLDITCHVFVCLFW